MRDLEQMNLFFFVCRLDNANPLVLMVEYVCCHKNYYYIRLCLQFASQRETELISINMYARIRCQGVKC